MRGPDSLRAHSLAVSGEGQQCISRKERKEVMVPTKEQPTLGSTMTSLPSR